MSHLFISHSSDDKQKSIRPLVKVLLVEGESVWIDRPGYDGFGFDPSFVSRQAIDYLHSGEPWSGSIRSALNEAGAVLGCLSRSMLANKDVAIDELVVGSAMNKLVTCIVDDLPYEDLTQFCTGLLDLSQAQAPRIRPYVLQQALEFQRKHGCHASEMPEPLYSEWQSVRFLTESIDRVRAVPRPLRAVEAKVLADLIRTVPVGPILKIATVPQAIIDSLSDHVASPEHAQALLTQTNQLVLHATDDQELAEKMTLHSAKLPVIGRTSSQAYWTQVFQLGGLKARRTIVALLMNPIATWAIQKAGTHSSVSTFIDDLRHNRI